MNTRPFFLTSLAATIACVGIAWIRASRATAAEAALHALDAQHHQLVDALRAAEARRLAATNARTATAARLAAFAPPPRATAASSATPTVAIQRMQDDPNLQNLQLAARRGQLAIIYGRLYRLLALTPAQISQFEDNLLRRDERRTDLYTTAHAKGIPMNDSSLSKLSGDVERDYQDAQRALLGESGLKQLNDYERLSGVREIVSGLAGAAAIGGAPLDTAQAERLVTALADSATRYPNSDWPNLGQIDWTRVHTQMAAFLTPEQLALVETTEPRGPRGMGGRFLPALHAAIDAGRADDAKHPPLTASSGP